MSGSPTVTLPTTVSSSAPHFQPLPLSPLKKLIDSIRWIAQKIFGYILRVCVFQLGEYHKPFAYFLMRCYQRLSSDPRETRAINCKRLEESMELLRQFGGEEHAVFPADGKAGVLCMTFTSERFFAEIHRLGGRKVSILYRNDDGEEERRMAILPTADADPELLTILEKKFSLPSLLIRTPQGDKQGILLPEAPEIPPGKKAPCILRCHSPGRSKAMDRKYAAQHLAAGYDVCMWDPRGTIESTGLASEGGYYLDADAVFQHLLTQGYEIPDIWVSGFCGGAATAAHLKRKYHDQGVNFIAEHPFHNLVAMVGNQGFLPRMVARIALPEIQSTDPETIRSLGPYEQDGFDMEAKFRNLPPSPGAFVLIPTDTDQTVPKDSVERIRRAINRAGPYFQIERHHPDRKSNSHAEPPTESPRVWHEYVKIVKPR